MDNQPNESDEQPNESNDPTLRLPAETRGKIAELAKDPAIAEKRRLNHRAAMRGNTFALQHGRYSKQPLLMAHLRFLDELEFEDIYEVREAIKKIVFNQMKMLAIAEFEDLQRGTPGSKEYLRLAKDTFAMLSYMHNNPQLLEKKKQDLFNLKGLNQEQRDLLWEAYESIRELHPVDRMWLTHKLKYEFQIADEQAAQGEQVAQLEPGDGQEISVSTSAGYIELQRPRLS